MWEREEGDVKGTRRGGREGDEKRETGKETKRGKQGSA